MAIDFTGTATEKTDKLVAAVVKITTTLEILKWVVVICFPAVVAFNAFVIARVYETAAKVDRLGDRVNNVEQNLGTKIDGVEGRLNARVDGVEGRLNARIDGVEKRLDRMEKLLEKIIDNQERRTPPKN